MRVIVHDQYNKIPYTKCSCGGDSVLTLSIQDGINISLCLECVTKLTTRLETFNNTIFCYKCSNFIMSRSGWNYGGSCKRYARIDNYELTESDIGYKYYTECMDTCNEPNSIKEEKLL